MFCHTCGCSNRPERSSPDDREIRSNAFIDAGFISFFSITKNSDESLNTALISSRVTFNFSVC
jgi:hypothetical protein